jgi:hypothetical protein
MVVFLENPVLKIYPLKCVPDEMRSEVALEESRQRVCGEGELRWAVILLPLMFLMTKVSKLWPERNNHKSQPVVHSSTLLSARPSPSFSCTREAQGESTNFCHAWLACGRHPHFITHYTLACYTRGMH